MATIFDRYRSLQAIPCSASASLVKCELVDGEKGRKFQAQEEEPKPVCTPVAPGAKPFIAYQRHFLSRLTNTRGCWYCDKRLDYPSVRPMYCSTHRTIYEREAV